MENILNYFKIIIAALGTGITWLFGTWDTALIVLVSFMALDYLTGVLRAWINKEVSSDIGLKGIARKTVIFIVLIVAVLLDRLLNTINERVEFLLDRDHLIGHAYFVNCNSYSDIINVVINKIIPLLQEYFYGDNEKVGMILGGIGSSEDDKYIVYREEKSANKIFKGFKNISDIGSKEFFRVKSNIGIEELKI